MARMCCLRSIVLARRAGGSSGLRDSGFSRAWEAPYHCTVSIQPNSAQRTAPPASISPADSPEGLILRAEGDWAVATAAELDRTLHDLKLPRGRPVTPDPAPIARPHAAGAR